MKKIMLIILVLLSGCSPDLDNAEQAQGKISSYDEATSLSGDDVFVIVDVSDTTMASSGTTKKAKLNKSRVREWINVTADTVLTESQCISTMITNQGDAGEADVTLYNVQADTMVLFRIEEACNIEINPPSGETLYLNGTALDADDCIDSDSALDSEIACTRALDSSGVYHWFCKTVSGVWTDTGASD